MAYTNAQVTNIITEFQANHDKKCWNRGLRNTQLSASNWGETSTRCADGSCTSNIFGASDGQNVPIQCYGFSLFMAYVIFGDFILWDDIDSASNGDTISSNWTYYDRNLTSMVLEPGDIVRTSTHSAMIWYIDNLTVQVIECWGGEGCEINFGNFNGSPSPVSVSDVLNDAVYILKAPKNNSTGCC